MKKKLLKTNKGITLIALIITIIVLLILAVVAIRAVNDGGIIKYAQEAKVKQEIAQEKEGVYLAANQAFLVGNGKITEEKLTDALTSQFGAKDTKWKYTETTTEYLKVQMIDSKREYKIYLSGGTVEGPLGEGTGGDSTTGGEGDGSGEDGTIDSIVIGETTYTNEEVLAKLGIEESQYTGTYDGTWTVIGVEGNKIKLVSTENVTSENIYLGKSDENLFIKDENGNPTTALREEIVEIFNREAEKNLDLEKAIWSYQHIVETLDGHAKKATGITSARSITMEDLEAKDVLNITEDKKLELSAYYGEEYNYSISSLSDNYKPSIFIDSNEQIVIVDSENDEATVYIDYYNYTFTEEQKLKFANSLSSGLYWLASTSVMGMSNEQLVTYGLRLVINGQYHFFDVFDSQGRKDPHYDNLNGSSGVRAVIYIEK